MTNSTIQLNQKSISSA